MRKGLATFVFPLLLLKATAGSPLNPVDRVVEVSLLEGVQLSGSIRTTEDQPCTCRFSYEDSLENDVNFNEYEKYESGDGFVSAGNVKMQFFQGRMNLGPNTIALYTLEGSFDTELTKNAVANLVLPFTEFEVTASYMDKESKEVKLEGFTAMVEAINTTANLIVQVDGNPSTVPIKVSMQGFTAEAQNGVAKLPAIAGAEMMLKVLPTGDQSLLPRELKYSPPSSSSSQPFNVLLNPKLIVTGSVKTADGDPVEGFAVREHDTNQTVTTGSDGRFEMQVTAQSISFIGGEVKIGDATTDYRLLHASTEISYENPNLTLVIPLRRMQFEVVNGDGAGVPSQIEASSEGDAEVQLTFEGKSGTDTIGVYVRQELKVPTLQNGTALGYLFPTEKLSVQAYPSDPKYAVLPATFEEPPYKLETVPTYSISGRVQTPEGLDVQGLSIKFTGPFVDAEAVTTNSSGGFEVKSLVGVVSVTVGAESKKVSVVADGTLVPAGTLQGEELVFALTELTADVVLDLSLPLWVRKLKATKAPSTFMVDSRKVSATVLVDKETVQGFLEQEGVSVFGDDATIAFASGQATIVASAPVSEGFFQGSVTTDIDGSSNTPLMVEQGNIRRSQTVKVTTVEGFPVAGFQVNVSGTVESTKENGAAVVAFDSEATEFAVQLGGAIGSSLRVVKDATTSVPFMLGAENFEVKGDGSDIGVKLPIYLVDIEVLTPQDAPASNMDVSVVNTNRTEKVVVGANNVDVEFFFGSIVRRTGANGKALVALLQGSQAVNVDSNTNDLCGHLYQLEVSDNAAQSVTLPQCVSFSGSVITTEGLPVSNFQVTYTNLQSKKTKKAVTNETGVFVFEEVRPGESVLEFTNMGNEDSYLPAQDNSSKKIELDDLSIQGLQYTTSVDGNMGQIDVELPIAAVAVLVHSPKDTPVSEVEVQTKSKEVMARAIVKQGDNALSSTVHIELHSSKPETNSEGMAWLGMLPGTSTISVKDPKEQPGLVGGHYQVYLPGEVMPDDESPAEVDPVDPVSPSEDKKKKSAAPIIIGVVAGVVLLGAGAFFFLKKRKASRHHDFDVNLQEQGHYQSAV